MRHLMSRYAVHAVFAILAVLALSACGGDEPAEEDAAISTIPVEETAVEDGGVDDATATPVVRATDDATDVPTESPEPTEAPTEQPTDVPPTAIPATVAPTAVPPTPVPPTPTQVQWSVEFYPDNHVYVVPEDQLCVAVNWRTQGVTDVFLQRDDGERESVEASGRRPDICGWEDEVLFTLYFKIPGGEEQSRTVRIERD